MSDSYELSIDVSEHYDFSQKALEKIEQNPWVRHQWPIVYFIHNDTRKLAYVGESTNASSRIKNHLANPQRHVLNKISIIGCDKFNKSATLDIESSLIQYITAEGTFELQNANFGLVNHNYYQQDLYKNLFKQIWEKLIEKKIVTKTLKEIEDSELYKYSPFKSLSEDQYKSAHKILNTLTNNESSTIFVSGSAGTGKTILASYLVKLLKSDVIHLITEELNEDEIREVNFVVDFQRKYPDAKIALVVAMTSLRETLRRVFAKVPGLKKSMVIGPSDVVNSDQLYDLLIVDEAHRLRQYRNIGWMGQFRRNNQLLGLDDSGTELDWIMMKSKNQIFFYDSAQSVKPSDVDSARFNELLNDPKTVMLELKSQMRVRAGNNYIKFIDDLLNVRVNDHYRFRDENYELIVFDHFPDLFKELSDREKTYKFARMIAGYSWKWVSKGVDINNKEVYDIELDGMRFRWNIATKDWINSPTAFNEIGCIHTTQGYDLNYSAVIFGKEIKYNKETNSIKIDRDEYYDSSGINGINDDDILKNYIINIYKTLLYRGIRGTFIYACDKDLREYLKRHIESYSKPGLERKQSAFPFRIIPSEDVKPYVNSIPFINIEVAAGSFSEDQPLEEFTWIEPPFSVSAKEGYFVCRVVGESMNRKIPNGSYCLFKKDPGGSRNGDIVLAESYMIDDPDFGKGYTIKEYHSQKSISEDGWHHSSIILKPLSNNPDYQNIVLKDDEIVKFHIKGIFVKVLNI